ncbi:MAG TPA: TIM barrel protein [Bryobacteraceae bacterium]|nr:TIM barrel protein [Bryobacteraceae bacterium]
MKRRVFLSSLGASLASAAGRFPANRDIKWALSAGLWSHYPKTSFTDILDVMRDSGFIGVRLTGYPEILKSYHMTAAQLDKEISKRKLSVATISFSGPTHDPSQHKKVVESAREAMRFLKTFGARHLVVFSPGRLKPGHDVDAAFRSMCTGFNRIGEAAGEMGFQAGVHNHLDDMVEGPEEVDKCMSFTDPRYFNFAPDTAHLHLGGSNVVKVYEKHKKRLVFMDYKDARFTNPAGDLTLPNGQVHKKDSSAAKFFDSIYDLGDGDIDFPACHRILKQIAYKGWICVDLDRTRKGPRTSYERCGAYVVNQLEPIYS